MNIFKLRELKQAIASLFGAPYTNNFPAQPHEPFPRFRGKPIPSQTGCVACGACAKVCPSRAIEVIDTVTAPVPVRAVVWHYDLCVFCGQCERLCTTTEGVKLSREFDLATTDRSTLWSRVDQELVLCQDCGAIIAPRAHLHWLIARLGPLSSGNFNLILETQRTLGIAEQPQFAPSTTASRQNLYQILCPHCRHAALIFNETGKDRPDLPSPVHKT